MNRALEKETADSMASGTAEVSETVRQKLASTLKDEPELSGMVDRIWSFGPRKCGPNVLINNVPGFGDLRSVWPFRKMEGAQTERQQFEYESSVVNGFQLATAAGPLCDEPLMGVAFVLDECRDCYGSKSKSEIMYKVAGRALCLGFIGPSLLFLSA